jgi:hypothetical protein
MPDVSSSSFERDENAGECSGRLVESRTDLVSFLIAEHLAAV